MLEFTGPGAIVVACVPFTLVYLWLGRWEHRERERRRNEPSWWETQEPRD